MGLNSLHALEQDEGDIIPLQVENMREIRILIEEGAEPTDSGGAIPGAESGEEVPREDGSDDGLSGGSDGSGSDGIKPRPAEEVSAESLHPDSRRDRMRPTGRKVERSIPAGTSLGGVRRAIRRMRCN